MTQSSIGRTSLVSIGMRSLGSVVRIAVESHLQNLLEVAVKRIEFGRGPAFDDGRELLLFISCSLDTVDDDSSPFKTTLCMIDKLGNGIATGPTVRDRLVLPPHLSKAVIEISADILLSVVVD